MEFKTQILDGKTLADKIKLEVRQEILEKKLTPNLAVILIGDDPASQLYVRIKEKTCNLVGIEFHKYLFQGVYTEQEIIETINFLNNDSDIDAILVQLPLPKNLNEDLIINAISPAKDVDCLHPENIKKIIDNKPYIISPLAQGIMSLIETIPENLENKQALILAKSEYIFLTLKTLLANKKIKVEQIKPSDPDLIKKSKTADILITAVGEPFFIKKEMIKESVILIDVGTNRINENYTVGDADYSDVFPLCSYITPVPGGVGPMTVASLLQNTIKLCQNKKTHNPKL
jgi:methylenetetrahydrofolate dehydrogenase (NADP+) / methenyltetrahydrofolate cyclohydrolase